VLELCEVIAVLGQGIESKRSLNPIFQITTLRVVDLIAIAGASLIEKVSSSTITLKVQLASKLLTLYNEAVKSLLIGKLLTHNPRIKALLEWCTKSLHLAFHKVISFGLGFFKAKFRSYHG
jgi:hypothetical protein